LHTKDRKHNIEKIFERANLTNSRHIGAGDITTNQPNY